MSALKSIARSLFDMKSNGWTDKSRVDIFKTMVRGSTHEVMRIRHGVNWDLPWSKKRLHALLASDIPMTEAARARLEKGDYRNGRVTLDHRYEISRMMIRDIVKATSVEEIEQIILNTDVVILTKEEHVIAGRIREAK